jgi:hypothetical protein
MDWWCCLLGCKKLENKRLKERIRICYRFVKHHRGEAKNAAQTYNKFLSFPLTFYRFVKHHRGEAKNAAESVVSSSEERSGLNINLGIVRYGWC